MPIYLNSYICTEHLWIRFTAQVAPFIAGLSKNKQRQKKKKSIKSEYMCVIASPPAWPNGWPVFKLPPSFPVAFHASRVDSTYLLICVAYELLWHAAEPPGSLGDMIELGDFGFLVTAVKLHSDDETAVQLCLQLTVGCWCLCGSLQGWGKFSLMKDSANVRL